LSGQFHQRPTPVLTSAGTFCSRLRPNWRSQRSKPATAPACLHRNQADDRLAQALAGLSLRLFRILAPHVLGRLVFPQPDVDRLPQQAVVGPGQVAYLGDELWLNPMHA
jgi:hypothetical protein